MASSFGDVSGVLAAKDLLKAAGVLGTAAGAFARDIKQSTAAFDAITAAANRAQEALAQLANWHPPTGGAGVAKGMGGVASTAAEGDASEQAAQTASRLAGALAPIQQLGPVLATALAPFQRSIERMVPMFDRSTSTIVTLARRIDSAMKFPDLDAGLASFQQRIRGIAPAAAQAVGGLRGFLKVRQWIANMGDVAGKSLGQIKRLTLAPFAASAKQAEFRVTLVGSAMKSVTKTTEHATGAVRGFGQQALIALGVFGLAYKVIGFFKDGITSAANYGETISKVEVIFGAASKSMIADSEKVAKQFNVPKGEILDGASAIGAMGIAAGKSQAEAAKFGSTMAMVALDMSSQDNLSFAESLDKIRSGLAGESEPLRKYAVNLSEAAVKQYALAHGIAEAKGQMTDAQKVEARGGLIQQMLARTAGDMARTQGSVANQFRMAGGGMQNFAQSIGEILLPAVTSGISSFNEFLASIVETFETNKPMLESWGETLKGVMDNAGMFVRNFGAYWTIAKLSATEAIANMINYMDTIIPNLAIVGDYLANNWRTLIVDSINAISRVFANFGENLVKLGASVVLFLQGKGFHFEWKGLLDGFKATAEKFPDLLKPVVTDLGGEMDAVWKGIDAKEAARAAGLAKAITKQSPAEQLKGAPEKAEGSKFAGAFDRGSAEARSAILKAQGFGGKEDAAKEGVKVAREQLGQQAKQTELLAKIAGAAAGAGSVVVTV